MDPASDAWAKGLRPGDVILSAGGQTVSGLRDLSRLKLSRGRDTYNVNEAFPIEVFFDLRRDITALALAQYFCQLAVELVPEGVESADFLRLVLNALHFLCRGTRPQAVLKAIVELRMLSEAGYMPSIAYCAHCGAYESERMYFKVNRGEIYCKSCYIDNGDPCAPLSPAALTAMRHIVFSDFEKIFSFDLSSGARQELAAAAEAYTMQILQHRLHVLLPHQKDGALVNGAEFLFVKRRQLFPAPDGQVPGEIAPAGGHKAHVYSGKLIHAAHPL